MALRFYNLGAESFWVDETFSVILSQNDSLVKIIEISNADVHPALYYILLHYFLMLPGQPELVARLLSAILGVISVPLIYIAGVKMFRDKRVGLIAAFLLSISFTSITYSQETRMYPLVIFLSILEIASLYLALKENRLHYWILFCASAILIMYTHYYGTILTGALFACGLIAIMAEDLKSKPFRISKKLTLLVLFTAIACVLFLPQLLVMVRQSSSENVQSDLHSDGIQFYPRLFYFLSAAGIKNPISPGTLLLTVVFGTLFLAGIAGGLTKQRSVTGYLVTVIAITSVAGFLLTYVIRFCGYRYFIYLLIPYLLIISGGIVYISKIASGLTDRNIAGDRDDRDNKKVKKSLRPTFAILALLVMIVVIEAVSIGPLYSGTNVDLRDALSYVKSHMGPAEKVVVINNDNLTRMYYVDQLGMNESLANTDSYYEDNGIGIDGNVTWIIISDSKDRADNAETIAWLDNNTQYRASFSRITVYQAK